MAGLSQEDLEQIVSRVTANVLQEMKRHEEERAAQLSGIRIHLGGLGRPGDKVVWAPWTVALPPSVRIEGVPAPGEAETGTGE